MLETLAALGVVVSVGPVITLTAGGVTFSGSLEAVLIQAIPLVLKMVLPDETRKTLKNWLKENEHLAALPTVQSRAFP